MNAFNLGDTNEAGRRMDAAGALDAFDPDVYYCRAEILRFTDPPAAAEQLKRYLATTEGSPTANVAKQTRVKRMLELLDRCIGSNAPIPCQGPWEHPRGHEANVDPDVKDSGYIDPDSPPNGWRDQLWWVTSLIGAVILGSIVAMRRRKTRT